MKIIILFILSFLLFSGCQGYLKPRPVRVFHGLNSRCDSQENHPINFKCVETGSDFSSFSKSIIDQGKIGCKILKDEIETLKPSFYVIGYSQGGLIARWIQLYCEDVGPLIKRMVLVGTPNLGVNKYPDIKAFFPKSYSEKEIKTLIDSNEEWLKTFDKNENEKRLVLRELKEKIQPVNKEQENWFYDKGVRVAAWMRSVLKPLNFAPLNYLNRKKTFARLITGLSDESWTGNLNSLDFLVVIANRDERVVSPPESVTFGIKILDEKGNTIAKPQTSEFIKTHPMIKKLWKNSKLINCLSNSSHSELGMYEKHFIDYVLFGESRKVKTYELSAEKMKKKFLKKYPNYCTFNDPDDKSSDDNFNEMTNKKGTPLHIQFVLDRFLI